MSLFKVMIFSTLSFLLEFRFSRWWCLYFRFFIVFLDELLVSLVEVWFGLMFVAVDDIGFKKSLCEIVKKILNKIKRLEKTVFSVINHKLSINDARRVKGPKASPTFNKFTD